MKKRWELNFVTAEIPTKKGRIDRNDVWAALLENSSPVCEGKFDTYEDAKKELSKYRITARMMRSAFSYILFEGYYIELNEYEIDEDGDEEFIQSCEMEWAEMNIDEDIIYDYFSEIPVDTAEHLALTDDNINDMFVDYLTDTLENENQSWDYDDLRGFWESLGFKTVMSF